MLKILFFIFLDSILYSLSYYIQDNHNISRSLTSYDNTICDESTPSNPLFKRYFEGMDAIYNKTFVESTCLPIYKKCGWPATTTHNSKQHLPLFVFSIGLEGAGHHLWTEILQQPVFDCIWTNARHYHRDIGDGVPRTTSDSLKQGMEEHFQIRKSMGKMPCKSIYDAEDSFPTGAIRKNGRVFMRPDLITLQQLDGILFNIKYLIIIRNTTDTALSALRRNFFSTIEQEIRTVEHTLTYLEAVLRGVPCHKTFIAHYEQALADPRAFIEPLSAFLELNENINIEAKKVFKKRLLKQGKVPLRKAHKLTQFKECNGIQSEQICYDKIANILEEFFMLRNFMWPTFAGNGFDFQ